MAQISDMQRRLCVVWKTKKPLFGIKFRSSTFDVQGCEWNLQMIIQWSLLGNFYGISLHSVLKEDRLEMPFRVTTFIEDGTDKGLPLLASVTTVEHRDQKLWGCSEAEILKSFPYFLEDSELKIVCLFHDILPSQLQLKKKTTRACTVDDMFSPSPLETATGLESLSLDLSDMLGDETFPDVQLRCGGRIISAHKAVLAARSEVFAAMFRNRMVERETGIVNIADLDPQILDMFLKYLYSGKIADLTEDTASSLYVAGDKYAVHALKKECSVWMIRNLTEGRCLTFLLLADVHSDKDFKEELISFIVRHVEMLNGESWYMFNEEHPRLANSVYQRCFAAKYLKQ